MKFKNQCLNVAYISRKDELECLDKIIDFLLEKDLFLGVDCMGSIFLKINEIYAFIDAKTYSGARTISIRLHFLLADYEDFEIKFFQESSATYISKPKGLPKELECFFDMANELRAYIGAANLKEFLKDKKSDMLKSPKELGF